MSIGIANFKTNAVGKQNISRHRLYYNVRIELEHAIQFRHQITLHEGRYRIGQLLYTD